MNTLKKEIKGDLTMKETIRRGLFETNSSSVHSITMCDDDTYTKWENGEILFSNWDERFLTKEELDSAMRVDDVDITNEDEVFDYMSDHEIYDYDDYWDRIEYETYDETFTTKRYDMLDSIDEMFEVVRNKN